MMGFSYKRPNLWLWLSTLQRNTVLITLCSWCSSYFSLSCLWSMLILINILIKSYLLIDNKLISFYRALLKITLKQICIFFFNRRQGSIWMLRAWPIIGFQYSLVNISHNVWSILFNVWDIRGFFMRRWWSFKYNIWFNLGLTWNYISMRWRMF